MDSKKPTLKYHGLSLCTGGPAYKPRALTEDSMFAAFNLNQNLEELFPYLNAVADRAELYREPSLIKFRLNSYYCVLYPENGLATPFNDRPEALLFMKGLFSFLNRIRSEAHVIKPNYKLFRRASVIDIIKLLPKTNCRECGFVSCIAFAAMLGQMETSPDKCPYIREPIAEQAVYPKYDLNKEKFLLIPQTGDLYFHQTGIIRDCVVTTYCTIRDYHFCL